MKFLPHRLSLIGSGWNYGITKASTRVLEVKIVIIMEGGFGSELGLFKGFVYFYNYRRFG